MREALDAALKVSVDGNDLRKALREQGYELDTNPAHKYATLRRIGSKKAVRLYRLGGDYDLPALRERIEENRQRYAHDFSYQRYKPVPVHRPRPNCRRMKGSFSTVRKIGGLRGTSSLPSVWKLWKCRCSALSGHFCCRGSWPLTLSRPLTPSCRFAVWVTVWVKPKTNNYSMQNLTCCKQKPFVQHRDFKYAPENPLQSGGPHPGGRCAAGGCSGVHTPRRCRRG